MSITIPSRDISIEDKRKFREATVARGIERTKQLGIALDDSQVTIRDLALPMWD